MRRPVQRLANFLLKNELTISFAESMTCGLIAHKIGSVSRASDFFKGSIVCYNEDLKSELLKVNKSLIAQFTAESQQVTDQLAMKLPKLIKSDIHAAVTGLAADGGSETKSKPVGTVFYSFIFRTKIYKAKKRFYGSPLQVRNKACDFYFDFILTKLKKKI